VKDLSSPQQKQEECSRSSTVVKTAARYLINSRTALTGSAKQQTWIKSLRLLKLCRRLSELNTYPRLFRSTLKSSSKTKRPKPKSIRKPQRHGRALSLKKTVSMICSLEVKRLP